MVKTDEMISKYLDTIMQMAKYRLDTEKNAEILAAWLTEYEKYCYENGIEAFNRIAYDKGIGELENLSYIIESKPEIFDVDEDAVREAWGHLMSVKDNGGGISEEEANILLDWSVQKARTILDRSSRHGGIMMDSLTGACGYAQMLTLIAFYKAGIKTTVNNASYFMERGGRHAFGTVTFPIEKNGVVENKQYLVDASYRQFFTTERCNFGRYYSVRNPGNVGPDAGYYMLKYLDGREVATEILKKGHIELTPEVLKKYAFSFMAERLNINNYNKIYQMIGNIKVENLRRILDEKQEEFDFDEEDLDKAFEEVRFPSLNRKL